MECTKCCDNQSNYERHTCKLGFSAKRLLIEMENYAIKSNVEKKDFEEDGISFSDKCLIYVSNSKHNLG